MRTLWHELGRCQIFSLRHLVYTTFGMHSKVCHSGNVNFPPKTKSLCVGKYIPVQKICHKCVKNGYASKTFCQRCSRERILQSLKDGQKRSWRAWWQGMQWTRQFVCRDKNLQVDGLTNEVVHRKHELDMFLNLPQGTNMFCRTGVYTLQWAGQFVCGEKN